MFNVEVINCLCHLISDFSLQKWISNLNSNVSVSPLPNNIASILTSKLGISQFLKTDTCAQGVHPYQHQGWNLGKIDLL
jgi:hypothetical protein